MYVCICHAIRERDIERVMGDGETTLHGVYRRLGCKPRCGKCLNTVAAAVAESAEGERVVAAE